MRRLLVTGLVHLLSSVSDAHDWALATSLFDETGEHYIPLTDSLVIKDESKCFKLTIQMFHLHKAHVSYEVKDENGEQCLWLDIPSNQFTETNDVFGMFPSGLYFQNIKVDGVTVYSSRFIQK